MQLDEICILVNYKEDLSLKFRQFNKKSKQSILDCLLKKIIKFNFNKIYLLCFDKQKNFFNLYHKKKLHNSIIYCVDGDKKNNFSENLLKLKRKIKKNFILLDGSRFNEINLFDLKNANIKQNLVQIYLTNHKKYSPKKMTINFKDEKINYFLKKINLKIVVFIYLITKFLILLKKHLPMTTQ